MTVELLPTFLIERLNKQYSEADVKRIIDGYEAKRPVTARINTFKISVDEALNEFSSANIETERVLWSDAAVVLKGVSEADVRPLSLYEDGKIYLQSLSSQLPPVVMDLQAGQDVLDMTAAPGGKTTQIWSLCGGKVNLTACERDKIRAEQLRYNLKKQGASANVLNVDGRNLDSFFRFDNILLDAPCSGSGILNVRNPKLKSTFTEKLVAKTTALQTELLKKALTVLKAGKSMVYSTCSVLKQENEDVLQSVLRGFDAEIVPIDFGSDVGLPLLESKFDGVITVCPTERYEGFFMAKIRKNK